MNHSAETSASFLSNCSVVSEDAVESISRGVMKSMDRPEKHFLMEEMNVRYNDELSMGRDVAASASPSYSKRSKGNKFETDAQRRAAAKMFAKSYLAAKYAGKSHSSLSRSKSSDQDDDINAATTTASSTVLLTDSGEDEEEGTEEPSEDFPSKSKKPAHWHRLKSARYEQPHDGDSDDHKFSVSEMKQLVMDSLPSEIRDQVPRSAWDRIFRQDDDSVVSDQSPLVRRLKQGSREDVSDIVSVISNIVSRRVSLASMQSDVSGITDAFSASTPASKPVKLMKNSMQKETEESRSADAAGLPPKARYTFPIVISLSSTELSVAGKGRKTRVSFGNVQVRNYGTILTVNPAVTSGPAIGLGWTYDSSKDETYSMDGYETAREAYRQHDILLSRYEREALLLQLGYSQKDIADSIRKTIRIKNQRKQTVDNLNVSPVEEFLEKTTRRVKRILKYPLSPRRSKLEFPVSVFPSSSVSIAS